MEDLTYDKLCKLIALSHRQPKIFIINKHNDNVLFVNNNNRTLVLNNKHEIKNVKKFIVDTLERNKIKFIKVSDYKRKVIIYSE